MSSRPKSRTFIVHHRVGSMVHGRYKIGARNAKEAESLLRKQLGKHITAKMYFEKFDDPIPYGTIIKEC